MISDIINGFGANNFVLGLLVFLFGAVIGFSKTGTGIKIKKKNDQIEALKKRLEVDQDVQNDPNLLNRARDVGMLRNKK